MKKSNLLLKAAIMLIVGTMIFSVMSPAYADEVDTLKMNIAKPILPSTKLDDGGAKGLGWNYLHTGSSHETVDIDDNSFCVRADYLPAELRLGMTINLSADIGYVISKIAYHDTEGYAYTDGTSCVAQIWEGDYTEPTTMVASETFTSISDGWHDINLSAPVEISGTGIYWIIFGFYQTTEDWFLFSLDDICDEPGCAWFSSDGGTSWTDIPNAGYCYTMNYEVYVEKGVENVPIETLEEGWNLVSIPFNVSMPTDNITVNVGGMNYTWTQATNLTNNFIDSSIFGWDRAGQSYFVASSFEPGYSYWVYSNNACDLWASEINIDEDPAITTVDERWNLVGAPYLTALDTADVMITYMGSDYTWAEASNATNNIIDGIIFGWDNVGQSYYTTNVFEPGSGYWLYANYLCDLWNSLI
jgi:hypothetical protein